MMTLFSVASEKDRVIQFVDEYRGTLLRMFFFNITCRGDILLFLQEIHTYNHIYVCICVCVWLVGYVRVGQKEGVVGTLCSLTI